MSETPETLKESEVQALRDGGQVIGDFKAVIRTREAAVLVVPGLGTFERGEPVHTNNETLIEDAILAGGLSVTIDPDKYTPRSKRKADAAKAKEAEAAATASKQTAKP